MGGQPNSGSIFAEEPNVHGVLHSQGRVVSVKAGEQSGADLVLFDAGAGDGKVFNWKLLENVKRPYFLAGGLDPENVRDAVERLRPFGVDVSSGIESFGVKDALKMAKFVAAVRKGSGSNAFP